MPRDFINFFTAIFNLDEAKVSSDTFQTISEKINEVKQKLASKKLADIPLAFQALATNDIDEKSPPITPAFIQECQTVYHRLLEVKPVGRVGNKESANKKNEIDIFLIDIVDHAITELFDQEASNQWNIDPAIDNVLQISDTVKDAPLWQEKIKLNLIYHGYLAPYLMTEITDQAFKSQMERLYKGNKETTLYKNIVRKIWSDKFKHFLNVQVAEQLSNCNPEYIKKIITSDLNQALSFDTISFFQKNAWLEASVSFWLNALYCAKEKYIESGNVKYFYFIEAALTQFISDRAGYTNIVKFVADERSANQKSVKQPAVSDAKHESKDEIDVVLASAKRIFFIESLTSKFRSMPAINAETELDNIWSAAFKLTSKPFNQQVDELKELSWSRIGDQYTDLKVEVNNPLSLALNDYRDHLDKLYKKFETAYALFKRHIDVLRDHFAKLPDGVKQARFKDTTLLEDLSAFDVKFSNPAIIDLHVVYEAFKLQLYQLLKTLIETQFSHLANTVGAFNAEIKFPQLAIAFDKCKTSLNKLYHDHFGELSNNLNLFVENNVIYIQEINKAVAEPNIIKDLIADYFAGNISLEKLADACAADRFIVSNEVYRYYIKDFLRFISALQVSGKPSTQDVGALVNLIEEELNYRADFVVSELNDNQIKQIHARNKNDIAKAIHSLPLDNNQALPLLSGFHATRARTKMMVMETFKCQLWIERLAAADAGNEKAEQAVDRCICIIAKSPLKKMPIFDDDESPVKNAELINKSNQSPIFYGLMLVKKLISLIYIGNASGGKLSDEHAMALRSFAFELLTTICNYKNTNDYKHANTVDLSRLRNKILSFIKSLNKWRDKLLILNTNDVLSELNKLYLPWQIQIAKSKDYLTYLQAIFPSNFDQIDHKIIEYEGELKVNQSEEMKRRKKAATQLRVMVNSMLRGEETLVTRLLTELPDVDVHKNMRDEKSEVVPRVNTDFMESYSKQLNELIQFDIDPGLIEIDMSDELTFDTRKFFSQNPSIVNEFKNVFEHLIAYACAQFFGDDTYGAGRIIPEIQKIANLDEYFKRFPYMENFLSLSLIFEYIEWSMAGKFFGGRWFLSVDPDQDDEKLDMLSPHDPVVRAKKLFLAAFFKEEASLSAVVDEKPESYSMLLFTPFFEQQIKNYMVNNFNSYIYSQMANLIIDLQQEDIVNIVKTDLRNTKVLQNVNSDIAIVSLNNRYEFWAQVIRVSVEKYFNNGKHNLNIAILIYSCLDEHYRNSDLGLKKLIDDAISDIKKNVDSGEIKQDKKSSAKSISMIHCLIESSKNIYFIDNLDRSGSFKDSWSDYIGMSGIWSYACHVLTGNFVDQLYIYKNIIDNVFVVTDRNKFNMLEDRDDDIDRITIDPSIISLKQYYNIKLLKNRPNLSVNGNLTAYLDNCIKVFNSLSSESYLYQQAIIQLNNIYKDLNQKQYELIAPDFLPQNQSQAYVHLLLQAVLDTYQMKVTSYAGDKIIFLLDDKAAITYQRLAAIAARESISDFMSELNYISLNCNLDLFNKLDMKINASLYKVNRDLFVSYLNGEMNLNQLFNKITNHPLFMAKDLVGYYVANLISLLAYARDAIPSDKWNNTHTFAMNNFLTKMEGNIEAKATQNPLSEDQKVIVNELIQQSYLRVKGQVTSIKQLMSIAEECKLRLSVDTIDVVKLALWNEYQVTMSTRIDGLSVNIKAFYSGIFNLNFQADRPVVSNAIGKLVDLPDLMEVANQLFTYIYLGPPLSISVKSSLRNEIKLTDAKDEVLVFNKKRAELNTISPSEIKALRSIAYLIFDYALLLGKSHALDQADPRVSELNDLIGVKLRDIKAIAKSFNKDFIKKCTALSEVVDWVDERLADRNEDKAEIRLPFIAELKDVSKNVADLNDYIISLNQFMTKPQNEEMKLPNLPFSTDKLSEPSSVLDLIHELAQWVQAKPKSTSKFFIPAEEIKLTNEIAQKLLTLSLLMKHDPVDKIRVTKLTSALKSHANDLDKFINIGDTSDRKRIADKLNTLVTNMTSQVPMNLPAKAKKPSSLL